MPNAMQIARSGLEALDARLRTISNNLANAQTVGFKRDRAAFETLMYATTRPAGAPAGADNRFGMGLSTGSGVRVAGTERVQAQGSATITSNALDLMIEGEGFFEVTMPDGTSAFTRAGAGGPFKLSEIEPWKSHDFTGFESCGAKALQLLGSPLASGRRPEHNLVFELEVERVQ